MCPGTRTPRVHSLLLPALLSLLLDGAIPSRAQSPAGTAFTYHGVLTDSGVPANDAFDLRFTLYTALSAGSVAGGPVYVGPVAAYSGAFACEVDFGAGAFDGSERWIEVAIRRTGEATYVTLSPRQKVTRLPYAGLSLAAGGLTGILDIAHGGTGSATKSFVDLTNNQTIGGPKTFTGTVTVNGILQSSAGALELYVRGRRLYWLEDNATSPNLIGGYSGNFVEVGVHGATIAGGGEYTYINRVTDHYGTVSGGASNRAGNWTGSVNDSEYAAVGGGYGNVAGGDLATVPGGWSNNASGDYSFAAGQHAIAAHKGSFVWGDAGTFSNVVSSADNQFTARASGGFRFFTNANSTTGVTLAPGGGSWASVSDLSLKHAFRSLHPESVLDRLAAIPVMEWSYTAQDPSIRHMGPTAQDFRAAFGLGEDDRHITTIDADGVLMAAVQGLHRRLRAKDREIASQRGEIEALRAKAAETEARLSRLEALLERSTPASGSEAAR